MLNHVITTDISNPSSKSHETVHKTNNTLNKGSNCSIENNILKDEDIYENGNKRKHRSTAIIVDSMLKDIGPRKMREAMGRSENVYIKSFSGADRRYEILCETYNEIRKRFINSPLWNK